MAPLRSDTVQVSVLRLCFCLLLYVILLSLFTHITSALITYDKGTLLNFGPSSSSRESVPGRGPSVAISPVLAWPSMVLRPDFSPRQLSMGDSRQEGSPLTAWSFTPAQSCGSCGSGPEGAKLMVSQLRLLRPSSNLELPQWGNYWRFSTAWYGTVRYGTVHFWGVFHWVLYLVPDTFLVPLRSRFHASRTVTKTWRVNSAVHWLAGENRHYCVTELATRDPPLQPDPLDLNQHSQRRIGRNFCLNKRKFLHQPQNSSVVVCWGSTDVPLVDSRGADPARAWWRDAEGKSLMYNATF